MPARFALGQRVDDSRSADDGRGIEQEKGFGADNFVFLKGVIGSPAPPSGAIEA